MFWNSCFASMEFLGAQIGINYSMFVCEQSNTSPQWKGMLGFFCILLQKRTWAFHLNMKMATTGCQFTGGYVHVYSVESLDHFCLDVVYLFLGENGYDIKKKKKKSWQKAAVDWHSICPVICYSFFQVHPNILFPNWQQSFSSCSHALKQCLCKSGPRSGCGLRC